MPSSLASLVSDINTCNGLGFSVQLADNVKSFLWRRYDPNGLLVYPSIDSWPELLKRCIKSDDFDTLNKEQVLSILFGLMHRERVVDGLWRSMFEWGVAQKLLVRLSSLDAD